jgi:hypothetical protein
MLRQLTASIFISVGVLASGCSSDLRPIQGVAGGGATGGSAEGGRAGAGPRGGASVSLSGCGGTSPDFDGDGYAVSDGDCDDCSTSVNPGAFDVRGNGTDEDCSGTPDDEAEACDEGLASDGDASVAARALGICRTTSATATGKERSWGLISARYVYPDGSATSLAADESMDCQTPTGPPSALSHGIVEAFGPNVQPRRGASLLVLSSGVARPGRQPSPNGDGFSPEQGFMCTRSRVPDGFPASSYATCGDLLEPFEPFDTPERDPSSAYDGMALELQIRAPTNANGFAFDFDFYTFEYTESLCSSYNDAFAALLYSESPDVPADHNIAFDAQNNPVCVNNGFVEVCNPYEYRGTRDGQPFTRTFTCQYGTDELQGTGFDADAWNDDHAATGWLNTRANILPGEVFTLRFAVWDAGDEWHDSTVLVDAFEWETTPGKTMTVRPLN